MAQSAPPMIWDAAWRASRDYFGEQDRQEWNKCLLRLSAALKPSYDGESWDELIRAVAARMGLIEGVLESIAEGTFSRSPEALSGYARKSLEGIRGFSLKGLASQEAEGVQ